MLGIAAKARRALEVGEAAVLKASDKSYKTALSKALKQLENGKTTA